LLAVSLSACAIPDDPAEPLEQRAGALDRELVGAGTTPTRFDFEGTWTLSPGLQRTEWTYDGSACEQQFARENMLAVGRDTLVLKKGELEVADGEVLVPYSGTYSHWRGFGRDIEGGVAYGCVAENITYEVEGELRVGLSDGRAWFAAEGRATNAGTYHYPRHIVLVPAVVGAPVDSMHDLFDGDDPDLVLLNVGFDDYAGDESLPEGCDFELEDGFWAVRDAGRGCVATRQATWPLHRVAGLPDLVPKGDIVGVVEEALPDGTDTDKPIENAQVSVYRQPRHVRRRDGGESDAEYRAYLDQVRVDRRFISGVTIDPDALGQFRFEKLDGLTRVPGHPTTWREAEYTVEVTRARSQELNDEGASENLYFEVGTVHNLRIGAEEEIRLRPFDGLGQKIAVAEQLKKLAPNGWGPHEDTALVELHALRDGVHPMTPQANEAVRRALWAEYGARDGLAHADILLGFMLDALASLVTDLLVPDIDFNVRNIAKAQKRIRDFSPAAARSQSTLDVLNSGRIEEFHRRLADRPWAALGKRSDGKAKRASFLKAVAKAAVFNPAKLLGAAFVSDPSLVNTIVDATAMAFDGIVDVVLTGQAGGFVKSALKKLIGNAIKGAKATLLDSGSVLVPSFTRLADEGLEVTARHLGAWPTADGARYRADRGAALQVLAEMNAEATSQIAQLEITKGTADGLSASADAFAALKGIPAFAAAEKFAKGGKHLSNLRLLVDPLVYTFFELPGSVNRVGRLAWGEPVMAAQPQIYSGLKVAQNRKIQRDLSVATRDYSSRLEAIRAAIQRDRHEELMDLVYGVDGEPDLGEQWAQIRLLRDRAVDEAAGWDRADEWWPRVVTSSLREQMDVEAAHGEFARELSAFLIAVMTGAFPNPGVWYQTQRNALASQVEAFRLQANRVVSAATILHHDPGGEFLAQLVRVEGIRVVDEEGSEFLDPSAAHALTVSAEVVNLSLAPIEEVAVRLYVTASSGTLTVEDSLVAVVGALGPYDGEADNQQTLTWTVDYQPGDPDDRVVLRADPEEGGLPPTRYNGAGTVELYGPDPRTLDVDLDGLPDPWERKHGLATDADSWEGDDDGDGVPNKVEHAMGLIPTRADTDGDGRSDGDELYGGALEIASDPLLVDTDGDGTVDGEDDAPLDERSLEADPDREEPCVAVDRQEVYLNSEHPGALVRISNACEGALSWSARSEDPRLARPVLGQDSQRGAELVIAVGTPFTQGRPVVGTGVEPPPSTIVTVYDVSGMAPDAVEVRVIIGPAPEAPAGDPDAGPQAGDGGISDGAVDAGDGGRRGGSSSGGGCGCSLPSGPLGSGVFFWLLLGSIARRRRGA